MEIGARVVDSWMDTSSLPKWPNVFSRPQTPRSRHFSKFHDLIISSHDSRENEGLFVKIAARVLGLWLGMSSGPK